MIHEAFSLFVNSQILWTERCYLKDEVDFFESHSPLIKWWCSGFPLLITGRAGCPPKAPVFDKLGMRHKSQHFFLQVAPLSLIRYKCTIYCDGTIFFVQPAVQNPNIQSYCYARQRKSSTSSDWRSWNRRGVLPFCFINGWNDCLSSCLFLQHFVHKGKKLS